MRRFGRFGYLLAAGAVLQGVAGAAWATGQLDAYPFAHDPDGVAVSALASIEPRSVGRGLLVVAILAAVSAGLSVAQVAPPKPVRIGVQGLGWLTAAALILIVPDHRVLASIAYTPILLAGAPFGWPAGASIGQAWPWEVTYTALTALWGLTWAASLVAHQRGRGGDGGRQVASWASPQAAARWGRWAVAVAVVIPLVYAATRWAWALGVPLGISDEVLAEGAEAGLWWTGAALATLAVGGAGLTLGLSQRWGEVVPAWVPVVGGRDVPPAVATVPAAGVAMLVTSAGLAFIRLFAAGAFDDFFAGSSWAVIGPELLWPVWGIALAAAAAAYHLRRRARGGPGATPSLADDAVQRYGDEV